ncbi:PREDICTED: uncharacterized protein LOC109583709 [Amphimedon queenslandica]|uniref:Uncharacterized protein n=1 Tax=Amphimedon queenslandica TaxID=400682 RepID=A0AAN0JD68_AMPQE|nr:PREDICTED: uncharacterized protein LOC109583709 [Amphimedon queenslandica]|eukprot:XP_019854701.1 PREDICTED: uncharacterized protein LOC109583709 [Amphimedon queenslandica]
MYLNGDYNVVFNNCSYTPQYSGDYSNCDDTVSNGVCSDGAPLTVRCEAECSTFGQVRLTDTNTVYYSNGTSGTTGNVEFCNSGTWNGVCQNDLDNSDANIFCRSFGYNNGSFISGGSGSSSSYINITCPNYDYNSPQFCSINGDPFTMCNNPSTLYCYDATAPDDQCYSGQVQIGNNYYYNSYSYGQYPNFTSYTTGNVEICVNNTYYDVCADQLTPEQALFLCRSAGFNADRAYTSAVIGPADEVYSYDASADSITSFTCPYGYFDSFCTYNFVYNNGCTNNGGLAVVSCVRDVETCNTGSPQLQDRGQGYFNNGTAFSIGRPSICYNNSYIPYCTSFDMNTARAFCGSSEYYYGARSYPIFGSTDDYGYNDQSSLIVSYLSCPMVDSSNYNYIFGSCYNSTSTSDNGGCSGISDEAVISCINRPVPCNLQTSLGYIESSYTGDSYTEIYQVGVCINATYGDVCSDGITDDVALLFCRAQGGYYSTASVSYSYTNRTYSNYNNDYAGFSCPYYAGSLSSCYDNVSVVNNCSMGYGGILVVECTQVYAPPTSCYYDGQVIFNNTENSTDNNNLMNSISGYVSVCVNGTPALVCGDASIGQTELASICFQTVGVLYGNIGTPPNVSLAPLNVSNDTIVANDFYCDPETFSCTSTPGSTCPSGYLTVTCPQLCNGPSFQLYNEQFYLSNGIEYVTGIPILCEGFAIIALCNDGSIYDDPASLLCDALGYENGISINSNQALYGTLPTGAQYFNNFTCPPDAVHYDNCTANFTFNRNCASSAYNYVIQCSRPAQIFGTIDVTAVTQLIEEGNTLTLTCSLMTNYPGALPFSWFRGSNLITPSGRVTISNSNPTANSSTGLYTITSQLMIQNTLTGDSGQYLCRVVPSLSDNIAITIRPRNECTINDPSTPCVNGYCVDEVNDYYCVCPNNFIGKNCEIPVSSNSAPVIVTPPMDQDVPLGSLVNLTCVATGAPQPVITWYLEGTLIPGANSPIYIIDSIQPAQRGTYSCRVMNSEGMDQATATVTINNVRQYFTVLTASGQAQLPPNITAVYNQTRDALIGNELSPGSGIIVADLTYALVPGVLGVQFIFTLRVPPMANTNGITNSLNGVTANIAANYPGISFSLVMRFDGCSSETLAVTTGSSLSIMWPEVGIGAVARPNCPCGSLVSIIE